MFEWIGDAVEWVGEKLFGVVESVGSAISSAVWDVMLEWMYDTIYGAVADLFGMINGMGAGIFSLAWVEAFLKLFSLFGWALFAVGLVVAVFDTAIEYQTGRANIQGTCLNVLKGFMAVMLFTQLPVELYKFCITLQSTFSGDLLGSFIGANKGDLGATATIVLHSTIGLSGLLGILTVIALAYCVLKLFFANIKRGGILLCQIAVGSLYMFSVPRGYADGFSSWCKQIFALCLTAFLQTSLLFLGLLTWQTNRLLGLGIMLSANEVPRIAQHFGLDTSVRVNMTSVSHTVNTAVRAGQFVAKKLA
ncbi:conjugal transfer protein TrbL family protein [Ruminococcus sp. Marseille-P6503]|uniref:conjugal transfer protein TrbL family protein n=1 Tax=Ruminococcus sp. Marseille-P6503 TaxID=2364796 RepID=UPI001FAB3329|nr:conjugal transfer protein TrbL family protein [Ruminococcus sp. Marseille-P6503]